MRLEFTIRFFQTNPIHYQLDTILTKRLCVTSYQRELIAMRMKLAHWTRLAVVVVAVAGTQAGCSSGWNKSGWKMPGSDMFSWSRKPSESTLAGSSPSLAMPSGQAGSPTSPASRNTPSPVSSTAANAGRPNPYGATSASTANATGPSFATPPGSMAGNSPSNAMTGGAGSAAMANGYTNGQYGMVSNAGKQGGFTPPTGYSAPTGYTAPTGYSAPAGYGATAGLSAPAANGAGTSPAFANTPMGMPPANMGAPGMPVPTNQFQGGMPNANALANNVPALPPAYGGPSVSSGINSAGTPAYTGIANNGVPAMPVGLNAMAPGGLPAPSSSMPNAVPAGFQQTMPSVANQLPTSGYRPGSVGRSTAYDFSNPNTGAKVPAAPNNAGLPPAFPATANGLPNGSPSNMYR
jgi:hypothetical protein